MILRSTNHIEGFVMLIMQFDWLENTHILRYNILGISSWFKIRMLVVFDFLMHSEYIYNPKYIFLVRVIYNVYFICHM